MEVGLRSQLCIDQFRRIPLPSAEAGHLSANQKIFRLCSVYIYIAKLETKTNLHLDTTAKLVPEQFSFETKALSSLEDFNEVEE